VTMSPSRFRNPGRGCGLEALNGVGVGLRGEE
jgi:hypothetical protein